MNNKEKDHQKLIYKSFIEIVKAKSMKEKSQCFQLGHKRKTQIFSLKHQSQYVISLWLGSIMSNGNVTVVTYSVQQSDSKLLYFCVASLNLFDSQESQCHFSVGALQDETISGVRVASVSLRLIQVTKGRICIAWGRDWRSRVLAPREPPVNPSQ